MWFPLPLCDIMDIDEVGTLLSSVIGQVILKGPIGGIPALAMGSFRSLPLSSFYTRVMKTKFFQLFTSNNVPWGRTLDKTRLSKPTLGLDIVCRNRSPGFTGQILITSTLLQIQLTRENFHIWDSHADFTWHTYRGSTIFRSSVIILRGPARRETLNKATTSRCPVQGGIAVRGCH